MKTILTTLLFLALTLSASGAMIRPTMAPPGLTTTTVTIEAGVPITVRLPGDSTRVDVYLLDEDGHILARNVGLTTGEDVQYTPTHSGKCLVRIINRTVAPKIVRVEVK